MVLWIRGYFAFRQFQYGVALILQTKCPRDLPKNTDAEIVYFDLCFQAGTIYLYPHCVGLRMIDYVIDHFGAPVMPNILNVLRQVRENRLNLFVPDLVFSQSIDGVNESVVRLFELVSIPACPLYESGVS